MDVIEARALHDQVPVIDLHADTAKLMLRLGYDISARHKRVLPKLLNLAGHVDLPRMRSGGVAGQFFGLWTFPYPQRGCTENVHAQLDALDAATSSNPGEIAWATSPEAIRAAHAKGVVSALGGIEGGQALEGDLDNIAIFARRGVRYIGLLHFTANQLGTPAQGLGRNQSDGLSKFGREVIREMNRVGVIVDLAHINRPGFLEAMETTTAPIMVSHTGVTGAHEHWRNIDDEQLRAVAQNGGCVGIIFSRQFLGGSGIDVVCDHLLHIIDVAGEEVPALGSDYDGFVLPPEGLEDISTIPNLTCALAARGVGEATLKKILGENVLRVLGDVRPALDDAEPVTK